LGEGRQLIPQPACLFDIIKTNNADVLRNAQAKLVAGGIDKTAGDEIRDAEDAVRHRSLAEQFPCGEDAGLVTGATGTDKRDLAPRFGGGLQKAGFTGNHARGAGRGGDHSQTAAVCGNQAVICFLHRRAVIDINIVRAGKLAHTVDGNHLLPALKAEFNQ